MWDSLPWYAACIGGDNATAVARAEAQLRAGSPTATLLRGAARQRGFGAWCSAHAAELALYPAAVGTLEELRNRRCPLGAVTNLPSWIALPMLDEVGLAGVFGSVVTYLRPPKPNPRCLHQALAELGVAASREVWYVGDTATDQQTARRAGVSFAWAAWGYGDDVMDADRVLGTIGEVLDL